MQLFAARRQQRVLAPGSPVHADADADEPAGREQHRSADLSRRSFLVSRYPRLPYPFDSRSLLSLSLSLSLSSALCLSLPLGPIGFSFLLFSALVHVPMGAGASSQVVDILRVVSRPLPYLRVPCLESACQSHPLLLRDLLRYTLRYLSSPTCHTICVACVPQSEQQGQCLTSACCRGG